MADEWPSTRSLPSGGLAELRQSEQLLPTELRGMERVAVGREEGTKPSCRGQGRTARVNLWVMKRGCPDLTLVHMQVPCNLLLPVA